MGGPAYHGRTHAPGGTDPIPAAAGSGIEFDTDNQGGYLWVTTNAHGAVPSYGAPINQPGLVLTSTDTYGALIESTVSSVYLLATTAGKGVRAIVGASGFFTVQVGTVVKFEVDGNGDIYFPFLTASGDIAYSSNSSGKLARLALGTSGRFLQAGASAPSWVDLGTATLTFTNKRVTPRAGTVGSSATPTINTDNLDNFDVTALATNVTSMTTNLSGTPTAGQRLHVSFTDDGTSRSITWGSKFEASTVALPTATVISTRLDVDFIWNPATSKWRCLQAV